MGKIILPNTYVEGRKGPLIFLAGPIGGASNWQGEAIKYILSKEKNIDIASPRKGIRLGFLHWIANGNEEYFSRQRAWERFYLNVASKKGSVLFWLPEEEEHRCEKVYGAMTRLELGQWMTNYKHNNSVRFCVGSDGNFPELKTILYDLSIDAPDKKVWTTLEETCDEAITLAKK